MNQRVSSIKRLCRAGVIAALYVAFTYAFAPFAFGIFQIRPAEALCILPLFFPEAIPALFVGCMLSNLLSLYSVYDVIFGSLATLLAAFGTYMVGRFFQKTSLKVFFGGLFPVLLNALIIPLIIVFLCGGSQENVAASATYFFYVLSFLLTESVWVYGLGIPLYFAVKKWKI